MPNTTTDKNQTDQEQRQYLPAYIIINNVRWKVVASYSDTVLVEPINSSNNEIQNRRFFAWNTPGMICENVLQEDNLVFLSQQESKKVPINSQQLTVKDLQNVLSISTREATMILGHRINGPYQNLNHLLAVLKNIGVNISPKDPLLGNLYFGESRIKTN